MPRRLKSCGTSVESFRALRRHSIGWPTGLTLMCYDIIPTSSCGWWSLEAANQRGSKYSAKSRVLTYPTCSSGSLLDDAALCIDATLGTCIILPSSIRKLFSQVLVFETTGRHEKYQIQRKTCTKNKMALEMQQPKNCCNSQSAPPPSPPPQGRPGPPIIVLLPSAALENTLCSIYLAPKQTQKNLKQ